MKLAIWDWEYSISQTFSPLVPLQLWFEFPVVATKHPSDLIEGFLMEAAQV
ncbi:MAG: hypothetical protein Q8O62_11090 [Aequorivita sp.]|nr:hypothetical protein [Aequorivita sp.]